MKVIVMDGQSGRIGQLFIEKARKAALPCELIAIGTNAIATSAMLKAGAAKGATGENPVIVAARTADVIVGPIAVGQSSAIKLLLPVNLCNNIVAGTQDLPLSAVLDDAVQTLKSILELPARGMPHP